MKVVFVYSILPDTYRSFNYAMNLDKNKSSESISCPQMAEGFNFLPTSWDVE